MDPGAVVIVGHALIDGEQVIVRQTILMEKKCKKAKWLSEEGLQIAVKRREAKCKGEKKDISI